MENVLAVSFRDDANAYEAMTNLKELESQGQISVDEVAVVTRNADGQIEEKDDVGKDSWAGTASGGLIGLLVGVIGGPLGILIGGTTGLLVGSVYDMSDDDDADSVLADIAGSVQVGRTALIADVDEPSDDVVDTAMARLGGTVVRRSVEDVEGEIAAAQEAQREAKRAARKQLFDAKKNQTREDVQAKLDGLKAKLRPNGGK